MKAKSSKMRLPVNIFKRTDSAVANVKECSDPQCTTSFGIFEKRVVCAKCSIVYCSVHCGESVRVSQGQIDPDGKKVKVCKQCLTDLSEALSSHQKLPEFTTTAEHLQKKLELRADKQSLVEKNIIKDTGVAPSLQANAEQLVKRQRAASLSAAIANRPDMQTLVDKHIVPDPNSDPESERKKIEQKLTNHMLTRPDQDDLINRNILKGEPEEEEMTKEEKQAELDYKLQRRPTIRELEERRILIRFNESVDIIETHSNSEYDRKSDKPWTRLTARDKMQIKKELNEFKKGMPVHEESVQNTRFHY
eukprot:Colp12_sorted_trinity150504_noHs@17896